MTTHTESKDKLGISSFGVSVTTLEDVFIKVGEGLEHTVDEVWVYYITVIDLMRNDVTSRDARKEY